MAIHHDDTKNYVKIHPGLTIIALIITFGILITLTCCENVRRKSPINFILLFVFTFAESFLLAVSVLRYYPEQVQISKSILAFGLNLKNDLGYMKF